MVECVPSLSKTLNSVSTVGVRNGSVFSPARYQEVPRAGSSKDPGGGGADTAWVSALSNVSGENSEHLWTLPTSVNGKQPAPPAVRAADDVIR